MNIRQSDGCVAIGTNTYDALNPEKLLIDCGTTNSVNAVYAKGSINNYFQFNIRNLSNGNQSSSDIVATANNGTETTNFMDMGINGSGYVYQNGNPIETGKANDCYILASGKDLYIVNNNPSKDMLFLVGGTDTTKQRMKIKSNGNVAIGYVDPGTYRLKINGNCYATQFYVPSDVRLKHDVVTLSNLLERIMKLRAVSFKYNDDATGKNQIGFIAQEMEEIFPELVTTNDDGLKGVSYSNVTAILLQGIKEQQTKIENLETRLTALENSNIRANVQPAGFSSNMTLWIVAVMFGAVMMFVFSKKNKS